MIPRIFIFILACNLIPWVNPYLLGGDPLNTRASYCRICDDNDPSNTCKMHRDDSHATRICTANKGAPFCMNTITADGGGVKISKQCATRDTCHNLWWERTSQNSACSQSAVGSGHLATGTTCSMCCAGRHCNDDNWPTDLLQFPDTVVVAPQTTAATTTAPTTSTSATTSTTPKPTSTTPRPTSAATTKLTTTRLPYTPHDHVTTYHPHYPHRSTHGVHHHTPLPSATVCMQCVEDPSKGLHCDPGHQTHVCGGRTPYCMTSYYSQGSSYRIEKSCADRSECYQLWWQQTSTNQECFRDDLLTSTGSRPSSCHYCCRAVGVSAYCNTHPTLLPSHLVMFAALPTVPQTSPTSTRPSTATTTTTTPSTAATSPSTASTTKSTSEATSTSPSTLTSAGTTSSTGKNRCQVCVDDGVTTCDVTDLSDCPDDRPFCMNTLEVDGKGNRVVTKECVSDTVCYSDWWLQTRTQTMCMANLTNIPASSHGLLCKWCCNDTSPGTTCNSNVKPDNLVQYDIPTTSPSTTTTSTTTTTTTTTTPKLVNRCQVCVDDGVTKCDVTDFADCPDDRPFCMNTLEVDGKGNKVVTKECVSDTVCYSDWWLQTRTQTVCMTNLTNIHASSHGLLCKWCCNDTSSGTSCNSDVQPHNLVQYDITTTATTPVSTTHTTTTVPSTSTVPSSTVPSTSSVPSTTTVPPTSTKTITTTTQKLVKNRCQVCVDDGVTKCDVTNFADCPDDKPFCLNTLEIDGKGKKVVTKQCVSDTVCYSDWWIQTRTQTECMANLTSIHPSSHGLLCRWCCNNTSPATPCNVNTTPSNLAQYDIITTTATSPTPSASSFTTFPSPTPSSFINTASTTPSTTSTSSNPFNATSVAASTTATSSNSFNTTSVAPSTTVTSRNSFNTTSAVLSTTATSSNSFNTTSAVPSTTATSSKPFNTTSAVPSTTATSSNPFNTTSVVPSTTATSSNSFNTTSAVPSTTAASSNPFNTTSTVPSTTATASTSVTAATTLTSSAKPTSSGKGPTTCWDCSNGCPFIQHPMTCTSGYCLTTVTDDIQYTRTIRKSCVDEATCYSKWWLQTSDTDLCLNMLDRSSPPSGASIICSFCCDSDNCNRGDFPPKNTLFDGKHSQFG